MPNWKANVLKQLYIIASPVSARASPPFSPRYCFGNGASIASPQSYSRVDAAAVNVHLCVQHNAREAVSRAGPFATGDTRISYTWATAVVHA